MSLKHTDAKGEKVYWPKKSHHGYYDNDLKVKFSSPKQKSNWLKKHNLTENPTGIVNKTRHIEKKIEEINSDRKKRGQRPLTKDQCVGNGVNCGKTRKVFSVGIDLK